MSSASSVNSNSAQQPNRYTDSFVNDSDERSRESQFGLGSTLSGQLPRPVVQPIVNGGSLQYSAPGQKVIVNFGSDEDALRSTRNTGNFNPSRATGNAILSSKEKPKMSFTSKQSQTVTKQTTKKLTATTTTTTPKPSELPITMQKLTTKVTVSSRPLKAFTVTAANTPTKKMISKTVKSTIMFESTTSLPRDDSSEDNTTDAVSTSRPFRLRPLVRRPGARRRVRPINRKSNFRPRSRGGPQNLKKNIKTISSTPSIKTTTISTVLTSNENQSTTAPEEEAKLNTDRRVSSDSKSLM